MIMAATTAKLLNRELTRESMCRIGFAHKTGSEDSHAMEVIQVRLHWEKPSTTEQTV